jgi:heterodisulfide reductase subunit A
MRGGKVGAVLVVGGGIAGIQASLDLAELGYYVYLVEESAAIGGAMAQLDKTFPTNDCSLCILSPKLVEVARAPHIKVLTNSQVVMVSGDPGSYHVFVRRRPRYVDEEKCTGCGVCLDYCPVKIPDTYNEGLTFTKNIHISYPQAAPSAFYIDPEHCLFLTQKICQICKQACKPRAIDFHEEEKCLDLAVGAIILAPGFGKTDPRRRNYFGYGEHPNVVTSVEFERLLCASGPYQGHLVRPSDRAKPRRVAFIQCVGSRDRAQGRSYCSSVCCTYSLKEAMVAKEHLPELEVTIFFMDMRTHGKGFQRMFLRARDEYGIRFVRSRVASVSEGARPGDLRLRYVGERGRLRQRDFDLVVLAVGMEPSPSARALALAVGVELNRHGFCHTEPFAPLSSSRPGIFVAGAFQGPKDIPESGTQASGAAGLASALLAEARGSLTAAKEPVAEIDVSGQEPRIGVFVCRCGINIAGVVDTAACRDLAAGLSHVVHAEENFYSCSKDTQERIQQAVSEHGLNRVLVAACSPRTHESLFQETIREAGLNRCLFEMVNIRDQCSWVHMHEKEAATAKAMELIRMAVAKARLLVPLPEQRSSVTPTALVIGGGLAGMTAALSVAGQGFPCYLIERSAELGGNLRHLYYTLEGADPQRLLSETIAAVEANPLISVFRNAQIKDVSGYIGNFETTVAAAGEELQLRHGVVILATGGRERLPEGYPAASEERVITQQQLEEGLATGRIKAEKLRSVVMIQCVGSRTAAGTSCSRICCRQAIKNSLRITAANPGAKVFVLYRDIMTYGLKEDYYNQAKVAGVHFFNYSQGQEPQVAAGPELEVRFLDSLMGEEVCLSPDLVVLSVGVAPNEVGELAKMLKVPLTEEGFFLEAHVKLRPVEAACGGIYVCGLAHGPKPLEESIAQAQAAAAKAAGVLAKGYVRVESITSQVDEGRCIGCSICDDLCPYQAIRLVKVEGGKKRARTVAASCKGCGICASHCPRQAISMGRFRDEEIMAQLDALEAC